ncbi:hypothetical protein OEZ86_007539 [Tetradesmus obliquus]|nr:hypothetical protein OEZ86_007539 [Tetradesmus obliquus]
MVDTLLLVKATERNGRATRDFIVLETITFFNLHRCLQFCFKPRQSDSTIDGKAFSFVSVATSKAVKAAKTAQLFNIYGQSEAAIGDAFTYEADGKQYRVEVVDKHRADGRHHVPGCIAGSNGAGAPAVDLDATNGKLLVRRFSKRGVGQIKKPPAMLAHVDTNAELWRRHMNTMRLGIRWQ